jgi:hypothetical protein
MENWEYQVLLVSWDDEAKRWTDGEDAGETLADVLDRQGADGWELVSATPHGWSDGPYHAVDSYMCFFKRPTSQPET